MYRKNEGYEHAINDINDKMCQIFKTKFISQLHPITAEISDKKDDVSQHAFLKKKKKMKLIMTSQQKGK